VDRKKSIRLTRFELQIMQALWEIGSGSVREIQERLPEKRSICSRRELGWD